MFQFNRPVCTAENMYGKIVQKKKKKTSRGGSDLRCLSCRSEILFSDNDRSSLNCASMLKGGWWWKSCGRGLNGLYMSDPNNLTARQARKNTTDFLTNTYRFS